MNLKFSNFVALLRAYFFKYTLVALTTRGATCLAKHLNGKPLQNRYFGAIVLPPSIYNKLEKHKKRQQNLKQKNRK